MFTYKAMSDPEMSWIQPIISSAQASDSHLAIDCKRERGIERDRES